MNEMDISDGEHDSDTLLLETDGKRKQNALVGMLKAKKWIIIFGSAVVLAIVIIVSFVATKSSSSSYTYCTSYSDSQECFFKGKTRLPKGLQPLTYEIRLQPDLKKFIFNGSVQMVIKCLEATNRIVFHQKGLTFDKTVVSTHKAIKESSKNEIIGIDSMKMDGDNEQVIIKTKTTLQKGDNYLINIVFHGKLNDKLEGFYKSSYKTKTGEIRYLATSHFEATAARQAFPCFDEPTMKAKFTITIFHRKKYVALSNMPVKISKILSNDMVITHFEESVKMSTYLVAFVVCDFSSLEGKTASGVKVRVWAPADQIDDAGLALNSSKIILNYYEKYFDINYPLPKLDLIAIPDFAAGAMENWGLITYRLTSLLSNPKDSSSSNRQWVATVVAHELAHQWFGNLVTMKWWDDLWLNEGFASYVENVGVNIFKPEWKMMEQFLVSDVQRSMHLDQLANSHPISVVVKQPSEIASLFDDISYHKGASLISMIQNVLGEKAFLSGLQSYLKKYAYSNAATEDLWHSLSQNTSVDVKQVMDTWTLQMGFPLVTIKKVSDGKYHASQEHFLVNPGSKPALKSPYNYKWHIPLTYRTDTSTTTSKNIQWMDLVDIDLNISVKDDGWIKANHEQIGFYRVNYPIENWKNLAKTLKLDHTKLSAADRAGLMDDAFVLARAGKLGYSIALELSLYLDKEREYVPWTTALSSLAYIGARLLMTPYYGLYQNYILSKVIPVLDELKYEDKGSHLQKYLRDIVFGTAASFDYKPAADEAKKMFHDFMVNSKSVTPNFRYTVYDIGVKNGARVEWEFMWKRFNKEIIAAEKTKLLSSLSSTREAWLLQRCLEYSLNTSLVKSQDGDGLISSVAAHPNGMLLAWDFFQLNWDILRKRYGFEAFSFGRLIKSVLLHFQTEFHYNQVKTFFDAHPDVGSAKRSLQQAYESIKSNIRWVNEHQNEVVQWLREHQS